MSEVRLSRIIAPSFHALHRSVKTGECDDYWLKGGRGSTKSSFIGLEVIQGVMREPAANAICFRKIKEDLKDSVYEQLLWAIDKLGVSRYWHQSLNPLRLTYLPTGQRILFRGLDKASKLKSIKVKRGRFKFLWFEELTDFAGMEEIRSVRQSVLRGAGDYVCFSSYNPPRSANNWVNAEMEIPKPGRYVHHSTYLDVPHEWLGDIFIAEAEHLKKVNFDAYRHEYLGEVVGTGGEVFRNITRREITDAEVAEFDQTRRGVDWGYATDPFHYMVNHYDRTRRRLYIFYEIHKVGLSNRAAAALIKQENPYNLEIKADSAEPKSINELHDDHGINIKKAKKGPDSVDFGVKFLQDLEEIVIDPVRCPYTAKEFTQYELDPDGNGGFKARFPDRDNHSIDACRYSLDDDMPRRK